MVRTANKWILVGILFVFHTMVQSQSLQRPVIWTTNQEKEVTLQKIDNYQWAKDIVLQLHEHVDGEMSKHNNNPEAFLLQIPAFATHDHENKERQASPLAVEHNKFLSLASDAGVLYHLTGNKDYAQFATNILGVYIDELAPRTPETTTICGYEFFDPRTTYGPFAIAYDFVYDFLVDPTTTVYNLENKKAIPFDNAKAQKAIKNMVGNVLQEYGRPDQHGKRVSNHPILTASGALFSILCVDDDSERERLFKIFWETGTAHQNSFTKTILPMFGEQGIWPESLSYSFMPIITMVLNVVDRIHPEMKVTESYNHIFEGNFFFDYLRNPNRSFVRYGDSKRYNDLTEDLYRYTLAIAERKGYIDLQKKAQLALRTAYDRKGGYKPNINRKGVYNNFATLELFWGSQVPKNVDGAVNFNKPTVLVKHAGIALQRNVVKENNEDYGLCGIIGGATYVHSHCTGIAMELYGANLVMGPNAGLPKSVPERKIPMHEHYFRLHAGNNTVIVNGTSHGRDEGSWKGKAHIWQNRCVNVACEPKHLEDPINENFSFATQALHDEVNNCEQERTLSTIRTSATTAYYFDLFRSKSNEKNKFHDYIYHNIGDQTYILNPKGEERTTKETKRYQNDIGDVVHSPGWRFFEQTKSTNPTSEATNIRFDMEEAKAYMHVFIPEGVSREYTKALAPPSREAELGYIKKKTQVLAIRQNGEAWNKPFVSIFEPSKNENPSIQKVEPILDGNKTVGAKVVSETEDGIVTDYILCQDDDDATFYNKKYEMEFEGRFAIVRVVNRNEKESVEMYMGSGKKLKYKNMEYQDKQL